MKNISVFLSALVALLFSVAETSAQITPPYYNPANVAITGGTINGTVIGGTTAAAGSFTALSATGSVQGGPDGGGGLILQTYTGGTFGAIYATNITPGAANYSLISTGVNTYLNGTASSNLTVGNTLVVAATPTAFTLGTGVNLVTANDVILGKTITAGGTTGARTINKTTGRVNFAAAATSLVVTNSLATANSIVHCTVATNDTTMKSAACVPAAGSFTIYSNAAATAETAVAFTVTN